MEITLIATSILLLGSVLVSKLSDRLGIPALVLFLVLGMLAGSDGPGGIYFDDAALSQFVGTLALILILFAGGMETEWAAVRPILGTGVVLATGGVLITALVVGLCARWLLGFSLWEGLLLGGIVSSTDAAAVFSILRASGVNLQGRLKPLLELESGSNDPMAVFLTIGLVQYLTQPTTTALDLVWMFVVQMAVGALAGYGLGRLMHLLVNRLRLGHEGLYPVLTLALALLTYSITTAIGGNGFLAVYLAGMALGNQNFLHKRSLLHFHDGLAWLMQIAMFLTLGLLVFPTQLPAILLPGLLVAACLALLARPLSVFLLLLPTGYTWREKLFLSWVGLRGAVPIILATYPLLAGLPQAETIFNMVFFVVLTSVLLQGASVPWVARWLGVAASPTPPPPTGESDPFQMVLSGLKELTIPAHSAAGGQTIVNLNLPANFLIVLVERAQTSFVPNGGTELLAGDRLLVLADDKTFQGVQERFALA